jgi:hypothetical protein
MNQPQPVSIRCPFCNLTNFASSDHCKRCKNSLHNTGAPPANRAMPSNQQVDGNTININISLPHAGNGHAQPNININGMPSRETAPLPQPQYRLQQQSQAQLPPRPSYRQPAPRQSGEYQLQNQTGFQQWQQMNRQAAPAHPPVAASQAYAPQGYAPQGYASHGYPAPGYAPMPHPSLRVYRKSDELMMHEMGNLPEFCIKCNEDASSHAGGELVKQKFLWTHPLVYIAIISPLIFIILRLALAKRATLHLPLCRKHVESRKTTKGFLIGGGIFSILMIFVLASAGSGGLAALLFFVSLITIALVQKYSYMPVQASKIDNEFVYLKGSSPAFLNRLPYC